ncbi:copper homeostasis protein CutC [soil metagenome]
MNSRSGTIKPANKGPMAFLLEIVATDASEIRAAREGGADRLELCASIELGGVTPSPGLVEEATERMPTVAMLRPHARSFIYDEADRRVLLKDLAWLRETRVEAVVFGALTPGGRIDLPLLREVVGAGKPVVFHRAFDAVEHPEDALESLMRAGVRRVLTSGGASCAREGTDRLNRLIHLAKGRIEILPGGGIRPENVATLLECVPVGWVHAAPFRTGEVLAKTVRCYRSGGARLG